MFVLIYTLCYECFISIAVVKEYEISWLLRGIAIKDYVSTNANNYPKPKYIKLSTITNNYIRTYIDKYF